MKRLQSYKKILPVFLLLFFLTVGHAYAIPAGPQSCEIGQTCEVGEFLYDDTYLPISNASCSITSKYPNGTVFVNSQPMASSADGWYSYDIVATGAAGLYRSSICCTASGEYMCLDKSFEVVATSSASLSGSDVASAVWNANRSSYTTSGTFGQALQNIVPSTSDIASAVWGYSGRTLTSFGTLVADIWDYSTRTITGASSIASDVWGYATRTLTGSGLTSGSIATKEDVDSVKSDVSKVKTEVSTIVATVSSSTTLNTQTLENVEKRTLDSRLLLEKLVNKPIIQNYLEEDSVDLGVKLQQTKILSSSLLSSSQSLDKKLTLLSKQWTKASSKEVLAAFDDIAKTIGNEGASSKKSFIGSLKQLHDLWDMQEVDALYDQSLALKMRFESMRSDLRTYGKSQSGYVDVVKLKTILSGISDDIGSTEDQQTAKTFMGTIAYLTNLSSSFDKDNTKADRLLANWKAYKKPYIRQSASGLYESISKRNTIPQAMIALAIDPKGLETDKQLKNKVLGMKGVIASNKKLLASGTKKPLVNMWLEEGSIVFKSLVTNPSSLVSQTVPLKYYLPPEVTKESILEVDAGLSVEYDSEKDQYFVSAEFSLDPEETKTISITVDESIFSIASDEIESLKTQAEELSEPLKNTSFFAQGVTLTSDINVALDKIIQKQKAAVTPEGRIRAYREAKIELEGVKVKMEKLKELVTQVSSSGSLVGFVGGAQAIAVWGLIIIMVTGFVFLVLYMRILRVQDAKQKQSGKKQQDVLKQNLKEDIKSVLPFHKRRQVRWGVAVVVSSLLTAGISSAIVFSITARKGDSTATTHKSPQIAQVLSEKDEQVGSGDDAITIVGSETDTVALMMEPSEGSVPVYTIYEPVKGSIVAKKGDWIQVKLIDLEEASAEVIGWVPDGVLQSPEDESLEQVSVEVLETSVGFLRVRSGPGGSEIARVMPHDILPVVGKKEGWYEVEFKDGTGWVSAEYVKENDPSSTE
ncbi:MAG: SH3 domain-containing protein [Candidatus Levybacteria bacterium]|nr:SH3 domain-containing protein [Candidatus Levybacteria bacterium]